MSNATIVTVLLLIVSAGCGEWKPTGDGRTVVNSRTGEIRNTATGLKVDDHLKEIDRRNLEWQTARKQEQVQAEEKSQRFWDGYEAQRRATEDVQRVKQETIKRLLGQLKSTLETRDKSGFVPATYRASYWIGYTSFIRAQKPPTRDEVKGLLFVIDELRLAGSKPQGDKSSIHLDSYFIGPDWDRFIATLRELQANLED